MKATDYTAEQYLAAIHEALTERDMPAVVALLHGLAVVDPNAAAEVLAAIDAFTPSEKPMITKYRKRPVVIDAVQFDGTNRREVLSFIYPDMSETALSGADAMSLPVVIGTLEGDMTVSPGDFVIKGVAGEFYPCKPDIFEATYELVTS